jgi:hypothetical protein
MNGSYIGQKNYKMNNQRNLCEKDENEEKIMMIIPMKILLMIQVKIQSLISFFYLILLLRSGLL